MHRELSFVMAICLATACTADATHPTGGWVSRSVRDEIRPEFRYRPQGGPRKRGSWIIRADKREGLYGYWEAQRPVAGGKYYRFSALQKTQGLKLVRRTAVARILWRDSQGRRVAHDQVTFPSYRPGTRPTAEPEFPKPVGRHSGWTELRGTYLVPSKATTAIIELYYRWEPNGEVAWSEISLQQIAAPRPRLVRLATVHHRPSQGSTRHEKCAQFAPLLAEAAAKKVDLIVLPETLTYFGRGKSFADCAEAVPGPSTKYFGMLAKKHNLYIVAGLVERDKHLIYNVAALIGPDGKLVGKYRKVTLPRGEIEAGITPGKDYPVFQTRFGKVGMMICYDGFFPEVARQLSNNGAEVIAFPVWGCNPLLASARACENHVYVVSSTYTDINSKWMISAVFGLDGRPLAQARKWNSLVVSEVDLNQPLLWTSLGDFKAQIDRHRPLVKQD